MNIKKSLIGCYVYENDKNEYFNYEIIGNEVRVYAWIKNFRMSHYNIEDVTNDEKIEKYREEIYSLLQEISRKNENSEWINISQRNVNMYSEYKKTNITLIDFLTSLRKEKSYPKFVFFLIIIGLIFSIEAHPLVYILIFCMIIPALKEGTRKWPIVALILNTIALLISIYIKFK